MNRPPIIYFFILVLLFSVSFPQGHVTFRHLTVEDGLSQSSVTCIFQDSKGFMWFGTQDGLNRFDGYNFDVFKNIPSDSTSLNENFIFSIYEDQSCVLYIETQGGTLHRYNPKSESFKVISKEEINLKSYKVSSVGANLFEPSGIQWTGGLGSGTGLKRVDTNTGETKIFKNNPRDKTSLSDDKVYSIFRDRKGKLWIGTFNGLDRLDEKTGKFTHYKNDPNDPGSLPANWVWPIYEDSRDNLWIGTVKGGLCRYDFSTDKFVIYKNDPIDPTTINDNFIFSIYEDRSGIIWIGTNLGGLNYFHPATQSFNHYKNYPGNKNSLSDNVVLSMLADRNGDYWIGTRTGGLNKYDPIKKNFTLFSHSSSNINSLISNSIQTLFEDRSGIIWIGTYSSGLDAFNPKTGTFTHYVSNPSNPNSLTDNRIYSLAQDKNDNIWIGTYGGGLNKLDKRTGKIKSFRSNVNDAASLSSNAAWSIAFDELDNLWIGTFGGGANKFNPEDETFSHFNNNPEDSTSIADNNIIRVFKDSNGNMWFGTTKGLSKYQKETKTFKNYDENDGLANSFVYGILEDKKGNLWLSTNNGISKFNPETETFRNYYYEDGLQGNEFNQNAFAKDYKTGRLLFGGPNGFNVFHPDSIKDNAFIPPIALTEFIRYNTDDEEGKPILEKGISERDSISLTYKDNIIAFEFAALSYYNNFKNKYKYKLEGFNENWIQLGTNNKVTFTNLSQGDYELKIIGSNNDGVWNNTGKSLFIYVAPPWWKTKIAFGFYALAFIGLLYGVRKFELDRREKKAQIRESALRIKATEAEKRALEIENERKTKELEEARQLQLSMLPKKLPELPNLEIAAFMRTATEVGGDYYDFRQDNGSLYVAFGDATGHGLQAGTMVTLMKGFFTSDSSKLGMQEFMNHCSRMIKEIELGRILMSFSYLKIDNNKIHMTSAGMPPIYFYNCADGIVEELVIQGMPLGAMKSFPYKVIEKEIKSGDTLLLITDGLPEQMNMHEQMFDYPRVKDHFSKMANHTANDIIEQLVKAGDNWMNGRPQDDDITAVVIRVK